MELTRLVVLGRTYTRLTLSDAAADGLSLQHGRYWYPLCVIEPPLPEQQTAWIRRQYDREVGYHDVDAPRLAEILTSMGASVAVHGHHGRVHGHFSKNSSMDVIFEASMDVHMDAK